MDILAWFQSLFGDAQESQRQTGIPASVILAQAALESSYGQSTLATDYHNLFGVKGAGTAGSVTLPTLEYVDNKPVSVMAQFASYASYGDSLAAHADLLSGDRYKDVRSAGDPYKAADALQAAGYATDPDYAAKLKGVIKDFKLTQYDYVSDPSKIKIKIDPRQLGQYPGSDTVTGSVFGLPTDTDHQKAVDRANAVDPPTRVVQDLADAAGKDIKNAVTGWVTGGAKVLVILVLIVILAVVVLQIVPTPAGAVMKGVTGGVS